MAAQLGVSAPTVGAALNRLVENGLLVAGGPRRACRVADKVTNAEGINPVNPRWELLILTHEPLLNLVESTRQTLEMLVRRMAGRGWLVRQQVLDFLHVKRPNTAWERRIGLNEGTKIIAVYGRHTLAEWATRRNVPMLFPGGDPGEYPVAAVAVSSERMAEEMLHRLTALGHRRIVLPLCDRSDEFKMNLRAITKLAVERTGDRYVQDYHNPESDYMAPDVTRRILSKVFSRQAPTALVFLDWKEAVAALCFLNEHGLRIPHDVSMGLLSDSATAEWFHPKLCRFQFPMKKLLTETLKWLDGRPGSERDTLLSGTFIDGDTFGPPPDSPLRP